MSHEQGLYRLHGGRLRDIARYVSREVDDSDVRDPDCSEMLEAAVRYVTTSEATLFYAHRFLFPIS